MDFFMGIKGRPRTLESQSGVTDGAVRRSHSPLQARDP
jgi:hypothetical protein